MTPNGITFRGWTAHVSDDGQRYVWTSADGRCACTDRIGINASGRAEKRYFAKVDGVLLGQHFPSLQQAMIAAMAVSTERAAA